MRVKMVLIFMVAVPLLASACGGGAAAGRGKTSVVAAFYPLAYAAEQVGGGRVSVTNLTPAGSEPHDLELTPRAAARIAEADVVLYLGEGFQPQVERAVKNARGHVVDILALKGLHVRPGDPHVWLDPLRYAVIVRRIGRVLHAPAATNRLVARLDRLDLEYRRGLAHCRRHAIVTSHEAFAYLAQRYHLEQVAITGLSPEAEATPGGLRRVLARVRASGATTVYFETLVSPRLAETVARETGARTAVLDPLEGLTPGEVARGEDYFSVMRTNLAALGKGLGCR